MDFCQIVEHIFIWIFYHLMAEAAASVHLWHFHPNQINTVNQILQNLSEFSGEVLKHLSPANDTIKNVNI